MRAPSSPWFAAAILLAVFGVGSAVTVGLRTLYLEETDAVLTERGALASLFATTVRERMARIEDVTESFSTRPLVRRAIAAGDWETAAQQYRHTSEQFPVIMHLYMVDASGTARASEPPGSPEVGVPGLFQQEVAEARRTRNIVVGGLTPTRFDGIGNVIPLAAHIPPLEGPGEPIAYLVVHVDPQRFFSWTFGLDVGPGGFLYVVDRAGRLLAHPRRHPGTEMVDVRDNPVVERLRHRESGVITASDPGEAADILSAFAPVEDLGWGVVVAQPVEEAIRERDQEILVIGVLMFGALAVQALLLLLLGRTFQRLRYKERQEEAFLDSIGDAVFGTDAEGRVTLVNDAAEAMFGWTAAEMVGRRLVELVPMRGPDGTDIPPEKRPITGVLRSGKTFHNLATQALQTVRKDGSILPVTATISAVRSPQGILGAILVMRDATEEQRIEQAKSELVSLAAHQLKTPPVAIGWYAELLADPKLGPLTQAHKEQLAKIREVSAEMVGTVNTILNVSRIELGTYAIVPAPTAPAAVVDSVLEELAPIISDRELRVERSFPKGLPEMQADPALLRVILLNLVSNACKYTPIGGTVRVTVSNGRGFTFTVADTGYGIPLAEQKRIFSRFFRASNVTALQTEGTGLGLYIVKSIVDQAGGKISFTSTPDVGTVFTVAFPRSGMRAKQGTRSLT